MSALGGNHAFAGAYPPDDLSTMSSSERSHRHSMDATREKDGSESAVSNATKKQDGGFSYEEEEELPNYACA